MYQDIDPKFLEGRFRPKPKKVSGKYYVVFFLIIGVLGYFVGKGIWKEVQYYSDKSVSVRRLYGNKYLVETQNHAPQKPLKTTEGKIFNDGLERSYQYNEQGQWELKILDELDTAKTPTTPFLNFHELQIDTAHNILIFELLNTSKWDIEILSLKEDELYELAVIPSGSVAYIPHIIESAGYSDFHIYAGKNYIPSMGMFGEQPGNALGIVPLTYVIWGDVKFGDIFEFEFYDGLSGELDVDFSKKKQVQTQSDDLYI